VIRALSERLTTHAEWPFVMGVAALIFQSWDSNRIGVPVGFRTIWRLPGIATRGCDGSIDIGSAVGFPLALRLRRSRILCECAGAIPL